MKPGACFSMLYRPEAARAMAAERSVFTAVGLNALNGMLVIAAIGPSMLQIFTLGFVIAVTLLFGPLLGFIVSSLYPRVEMTVGKRLGGLATLDELYRIFAWSFLPVGLALLLFTVTLSVFVKMSAIIEYIVSFPFFVLLLCSLRNYCSNIIATQQFSRMRGAIAIALTLILFIVLLSAGVGIITILFRGGACESLSAIVSWS